jgi:DNA-binding NarL/FixJ family response regulator
MFRTLIVEDNDNFRHSLSEVLRGSFPCMIIDEAGDGDEALDKLLHQRPQLIFMDIKLPRISGLDLTRIIRKQYADIVIAVITAYDIPEYRDAALESGANYFLPKSSTSGSDVLALVDSVFPEVCG